MAIAIDIGPDVQQVRRGPLALSVLRSLPELHAHEARWGELDRHAASPMQSYAWIEAAAATFEDQGRLEILVAHDGSQIAAAVPLVASRHFGRRRELLNYRGLYEPADAAFVDAEANLAVTRELARLGSLLFFERMFASSPTIGHLEGAIAGRGKLVVRPQAATPWIGLDESWSSPEAKLSSKRRSDFRRSRRHAEQSGDVRAEFLSPEEHQVDRALDRAFEVERRSWKGTAGTALADSRAGYFYRRYARRVAGRNELRVAFLHVGQELAAMQLGVVHANRYWVLKVGYDPQFHRASPGILLMVEAIKQAVSEGLETYELLGTVEPWIQVWTELERPCVAVRYYPANVGGALAIAADMAGKLRRSRGRPCKS